MKMHIRYLLIFLSSLVLLFSLFQIVNYINDLRQNKHQAAEARNMYYTEKRDNSIKADVPEASQDPEPKHEISEEALQSPDISEAFIPLKEVNEDTVGWLHINETKIDYPVVQHADNSYYLDKDFKGRENRAGSIFMDFRNSILEDNQHIVLYGHNMKNGSMFADLLKYESLWNFENHSDISFDTLYGEGEWKLFSAYFTDVDHDYIRTDFQNDEQFLSFIHDIQERSLHSTDIEISANDTILTLSTCSSASRDDQRFAVHAVRKK